MDTRDFNPNKIPLFFFFILIIIWGATQRIHIDSSLSQIDAEANKTTNNQLQGITLSTELIQQYKGVYSFEKEEENYTLVLQQIGTNLKLISKDKGGIFTIRATSDSTFIDINKENTFVMRKGKNDNQFLIWNKVYEFQKITTE